MIRFSTQAIFIFVHRQSTLVNGHEKDTLNATDKNEPYQTRRQKKKRKTSPATKMERRHPVNTMSSRRGASQSLHFIFTDYRRCKRRSAPSRYSNMAAREITRPAGRRRQQERRSVGRRCSEGQKASRQAGRQAGT